jgi:signal transduction histidine kinase
MTLRRPRIRPSVRLRLTLTYSGLFVVAGAALLSVNYFLVSHHEHKKSTAIGIVCSGKAAGLGLLQAGPIAGTATPPAKVPSPAGCSSTTVNGKPAEGITPPAYFSTRPAPGDAAKVGALRQLAVSAQDHTLHTLQIESGVALGLMAIVSLGLGWLVAGRVLRPVHRITDTARRLSQETLHERIGLGGPDDELKELADTFDAMLARLDRAFTSQRRFVANASHELRTPLATERVLIDEALANRRASTTELRNILEELRANSEHSERLIGSLLVLARSERGFERWLPIDLTAIADEVVEHAKAEAVTKGVDIRTDLKPAATTGDPALLERLVGNLVENGIRHNLPTGGWLEVSTISKEGRALLQVSNSGRVLDPDELPRLFEPFRREGADRTTTDGGFGLGLSIVQAVVEAHGGQLETTARPDGGLHITVSLRAAPPIRHLPGPEPLSERSEGSASMR